MDGKIVWITGASSGLGKALAQECAARGAEVILTARRFEELENVRQSLAHPERHISITVDITDEAQVRSAYEQVLQKKSKIDWLINNAGLAVFRMCWSTVLWVLPLVWQRIFRRIIWAKSSTHWAF